MVLQSLHEARAKERSSLRSFSEELEKLALKPMDVFIFVRLTVESGPRAGNSNVTTTTTIATTVDLNISINNRLYGER
ncbi:hypothetical protein M0802_009729 [Mischocyttarus mexicanus]|nr:hypothetical protein M0802_009729 [Mischocyttarus mexicanus]